MRAGGASLLQTLTSVTARIGVGLMIHRQTGLGTRGRPRADRVGVPLWWVQVDIVKAHSCSSYRVIHGKAVGDERCVTSLPSTMALLQSFSLALAAAWPPA